MARGHRHDMPFGAVPGDAGVRFRLWAPQARSVALLLYDERGVAGPRLPMVAGAAGWYELTTTQARAGTRYRFRIDDKLDVPDPASRCNDGVDGPSIVVDPHEYSWKCAGWRGRPWHEAVIYELHVGTFTPEGTFQALVASLDHLAETGVTFLELMPIGAFPGNRGWGYDGVLPFAPQRSYGRPDDLKALVDAAHARGLGILLDVVYNHFGPEGNWLHAYAPQFFTSRHQTPWGDAINFDAAHSETVREFFIHNALYWLEEFQLDGLRIDAVHAMHDEGPVHFVEELAARIHDGPGAVRDVHLVLENHDNRAQWLGPPGVRGKAEAQWNDDVHHCLHVLCTGEVDGYYADYATGTHERLARGLAEGFVYQGEPVPSQGGKPRGEPSSHLPPTAFVNFLQNHDQIGNRAFGERLGALVPDDARLRAVTMIVLLAPAPPLLFMGEEWCAPEPFTYFCDFEPDLAGRVREGRKREFEKFSGFSGDSASSIPDPTAPDTFERVKLDRARLQEALHREWHGFYRRLLQVRRDHVVPLLPALGAGRVRFCDGTAFGIAWPAKDGRSLQLAANLGAACDAPSVTVHGEVLACTHAAPGADRGLPAWSVTWWLEPRA